jgi:Lon protease-like protein
MALPRLVPLFPLPNVVLFPQMPMPLHVFEPRYRKMVADALDGARVIGMTLLQPGWEPSYDGRPPIYPIGCAGTLEEVEPLDDGRYNILLRGETRFRIRAEYPGEPYRLAEVEALSDPLGDESSLAQVRLNLLSALASEPDAGGPIVQMELPDAVFVNALCQTLALTPVERQSLLDCDTLTLRSQRLLEILEFQRLERSSGSRRRSAH